MVPEGHIAIPKGKVRPAYKVLFHSVVVGGDTFASGAW